MYKILHIPTALYVYDTVYNTNEHSVIVFDSNDTSLGLIIFNARNKAVRYLNIHDSFDIDRDYVSLYRIGAGDFELKLKLHEFEIVEVEGV